MTSDNYSSPYARPAPQYPSQSEDFISLEFGGSGPSTQKTPQQNNSQCLMSSTPAKYSGNPPNFFSQNRRRQNRGGGPNRFYGANNNRHSHGGFGLGYQQNYQQQQNRWSPNGRDGMRGGGSSTFQNRNRGGGGHFKNKNFGKNEFDFNSYYHPTMLEDPWHDLMERHNALRKSEINFESTMQHDSSNSGSISENEQKEGGSDDNDEMQQQI